MHVHNNRVPGLWYSSKVTHHTLTLVQAFRLAIKNRNSLFLRQKPLQNKVILSI